LFDSSQSSRRFVMWLKRPFSILFSLLFSR
jgi:hypothetical protein